MNKSAYMDGYLYKEASVWDRLKLKLKLQRRLKQREKDRPLPPDEQEGNKTWDEEQAERDLQLQAEREQAEERAERVLQRQAERDSSDIPGYNKGYSYDPEGPHGRLAKTYGDYGQGKVYFPRPIVENKEKGISLPKVTAGQVAALKESLPGFRYQQSSKESPSKTAFSKTGPGIIGQIWAPGPDSEENAGLPELAHEYVHAVDPNLLARSSRPDMWLPTQEHEMPAMVTERAVHASGYIPKHMQEPLTGSMLEKQIEKYGPVIRGPQTGTPSEPELKRSTAKDLGNIKQWVHSLRRMPGSTLPVREPYAYKQDPRTGEQRASALGEAYRRWMNRQVESDPNAPVALRSMDDTVKAKQ